MEIKENEVYNCDCLEIMKELENESIDLIITDPPYLTTARGKRNKKKAFHLLGH